MSGPVYEPLQEPAAEPRLVLDCRGMLCPRPIIELARHYDRVAIGELIGVVSDDMAAASDVPAWCRMRAQEFVGATTAPDGVPLYLVRRLG